MADLPPEPPIGSIVVDRFDRAWQHTESGWALAGGKGAYPWGYTAVAFAPLTVLREGPAREEDA